MPKPTPLELVETLCKLNREKRNIHKELWCSNGLLNADELERLWECLMANGRDTADVLRMLRDALTPAVEHEPMDDEEVAELIRESRLD